MPSFKDIEDTSKNALLAEEVKAKGWWATHGRTLLLDLACVAIGFILGKLI